MKIVLEKQGFILKHRRNNLKFEGYSLVTNDNITQIFGPILHEDTIVGVLVPEQPYIKIEVGEYSQEILDLRNYLKEELNKQGYVVIE